MRACVFVREREKERSFVIVTRPKRVIYASVNNRSCDRRLFVSKLRTS